VIDDELRARVRAGLAARPRRLPFALLYDDLGSALFEAITHLPEYGLTRADERLIARHGAEAVSFLPTPIEVAELGPGNGRKAIAFVAAARERQGRVRFFAIDVSEAALTACARTLEAETGATVVRVEARYLVGLEEVARLRSPGEPLLVLFLGSNIGNFDREDAGQFLRRLRSHLREGDALLLSADLVKPAAMLERAYDDELGITAAFNRNMLRRLNRELGATFDVAAWRHHARWNAESRRMEMHLEATAPQHVRVAELDLTFDVDRGEMIWTESSNKFEPEEVVGLGEAAGFSCRRQWIDDEWPFALSLFVAASSR
jgi:dimethylhistidine N-methyltransferase